MNFSVANQTIIFGGFDIVGLPPYPFIKSQSQPAQSDFGHGVDGLDWRWLVLGSCKGITFDMGSEEIENQ